MINFIALPIAVEEKDHSEQHPEIPLTPTKLKGMPDSEVPELIKLINGNAMGMNKLVEIFHQR